MTSLIKIEDISHVHFCAPDLEVMQAFLEDFGLLCQVVDGKLYGRGSDGSPFAHVTERGPAAFIGIGLRASSEADLALLAKHDGVEVKTSDAPGGGSIVHLRDPDGNRVDVVADQDWIEPTPLGEDLPFNTASLRRRFRLPVRLLSGPSPVHRLGHAVLNVSDFRELERWYKDRFGFITSDEIEATPNVVMGAFMRCDRGDQPTDHHTLFLAQLPSGKGFNHAAFEVAGFDALMTGHAHLKLQGHKSTWGVGRHILGSQIFDYWKDPWGNELEHWTDGDVFIAADGSKKATVRDLLAVQWGPSHPQLAGRLAPSPETVGKIMAFVVHLRRIFRRKKGNTT